MAILTSAKGFGPAVAVSAALVLGACSSTTYGTGKTAAAQTVEDLGGIMSLGGKKKGVEPIVYAPRAPIVEPPAMAAALPPPGDPTVTPAGDWPTDPDEEAKRQMALAQELAESGQSLKFTLPESANRGKPVLRSDSNRPHSRRTFEERLKNSTDNEAQKKLFADAKMAKTGSVDAEGKPVRRYLTEPPVVYREPDLESPVEITEAPKKKKFKWPDLWPF